MVFLTNGPFFAEPLLCRFSFVKWPEKPLEDLFLSVYNVRDEPKRFPIERRDSEAIEFKVICVGSKKGEER
jgi:hypothetical protein